MLLQSKGPRWWVDSICWRARLAESHLSMTETDYTPPFSPLVGHVWSAAGHYPALLFSLHTTWTAHLIPLSLQWGVNCTISFRQDWIIATCFPKITPCLLSLLVSSSHHNNTPTCLTVSKPKSQTVAAVNYFDVRFRWNIEIEKPQGSSGKWVFCQEEDSWELKLSSRKGKKSCRCSNRDGIQSATITQLQPWSYKIGKIYVKKLNK